MSLFGTPSANSGSLFGSNSNNNSSNSKWQGPSINTNTSSGSLFNTNTNTSNQPQSGGLFGSTSQPAQSGGLFGQTSTSSAPQNQAGSSLLGGSGATAGAGGGLFGNAATSQVQSGGGLFGSSTSKAGPGGGGLFGSNTNQQNPSGGMFGSTTNQAQAGGPSLFGTSNAYQQPSGSGGLFGAGAQNRPILNLGTSSNQPSKPSLFGSTTNQPQLQQSNSSSRLPTLSLGQSTTSQQQAQSTVPGVKIDLSQIRGTTRFSDLYEEVQQRIATIDDFIAQQIRYKEQCAAMMPAHGEDVASLAPDVEYVSGRVGGVEMAIDNDSIAVKEQKGVVLKDADDARRCFRAIENLKLPQHFHYSGMYGGGASTSARGDLADDSGGGDMDLVGYFDRLAKEMGDTLNSLKTNLAEVEGHVGMVEANAVAQGSSAMFRRNSSEEDQVRDLARVLREFEGGILGVAGKVGQARESVQEVISKGR